MYRALRADAEGYVNLIDFGLSKVLSKAEGTAETLVGTPLYMSPELCAGQRAPRLRPCTVAFSRPESSQHLGCWHPSSVVWQSNILAAQSFKTSSMAQEHKPSRHLLLQHILVKW